VDNFDTLSYKQQGTCHGRFERQAMAVTQQKIQWDVQGTAKNGRVAGESSAFSLSSGAVQPWACNY
jgi:hypothetical protein